MSKITTNPATKNDKEQENVFNDAEIGSLWRHHPQNASYMVAYEKFKGFEQLSNGEVWFVGSYATIMKLSDLKSDGELTARFKAMFIDHENIPRVGWILFNSSILQRVG